MTITAEQRVARRECIGSSDMAAILGVDPWKTAYDVYLEKAGKLIEFEDKPTEVMKAGNRFESGVLDFAEERLGHLIRNPASFPIKGTPIRTNIDALAKRDDGGCTPVEGKTTGLFGPLSEWWGAENTDQVPDRVIVQCHVHMMALPQAGICHVPTFIGGRGFVMFAVQLDQRIIDVIGEKAIDFWDNHVLADMPPVGSQASLQIVRLIKRAPKKTVAIDPALVGKWLDATEIKSEACKAAEAAQAEVLIALGDAEAGLAGHLGAVTYYEVNRSGFTVKPTTFRQLRHKKKGL